MGTRESIRARIQLAEDIACQSVDVPEWGCTGDQRLMVRALTGTQRDEWEKSMIIRDGKKAEFNASNIRAKLVVRCVVDDKGERVFSDDDAGWLGDKSASALSRVYDVAAKLSRVTPDDVEDLAKNSVSDQSVDFISVSH